MCGRFALTTNEAERVEEFAITGVSSSHDPLPANWNIKPTEEIYIIRHGESDANSRELTHVSWGLIAPWSKNESDAVKSQSQAINARSESIHEKPTFKRAFSRSRCLIPATGYYEWATELGRYKTKQPVFISRDDSRPLAFAGIYGRWISPQGEIRESAAIITREAVEPLAGTTLASPLLSATTERMVPFEITISKRSSSLSRYQVGRPGCGRRYAAGAMPSETTKRPEPVFVPTLRNFAKLISSYLLMFKAYDGP